MMISRRSFALDFYWCLPIVVDVIGGIRELGERSVG
jgi:hypothetical protein